MSHIPTAAIIPNRLQRIAPLSSAPGRLIVASAAWRLGAAAVGRRRAGCCRRQEQVRHREEEAYGTVPAQHQTSRPAQPLGMCAEQAPRPSTDQNAELGPEG
ncbi:hypothetical protein ACFY7Y_20155 [Streptomyces virginiae]|uniref:hypothetical protein n=1 Tax=Streptomyces virginiae TaxID=1961 RepID=UPI00368D55A0